jgi:hypothetical protein
MKSRKEQHCSTLRKNTKRNEIYKPSRNAKEKKCENECVEACQPRPPSTLYPPKPGGPGLVQQGLDPGVHLGVFEEVGVAQCYEHDRQVWLVAEKTEIRLLDPLEVGLGQVLLVGAVALADVGIISSSILHKSKTDTLKQGIKD